MYKREIEEDPGYSAREETLVCSESGGKAILMPVNSHLVRF